MPQRHGDDKPTGRLGVEQCIVTCDVGLTRHGTQVEVHAQTPSKGHLSSSHTKTPVRAVMAGTDEATLYGLRQRFIEGTGALRLHLRDAVANGAVHGVVLRTTEFSTGFAENKDEVTRLLNVHGDGTAHVGHTSYDREEQRW